VGTRGSYGFRENNIDTLYYSHYDSYPSGLGEAVLQAIKDKNYKAKNLSSVDALEEDAQDNDFVLRSLYCEYAYVMNLDTQMLEFYRGFSTSIGNGRYADKGEYKASLGEHYYGVSLVQEFSFKEIEKENIEAIVELMNKLTDEDDEEDEE